MSVSSAIASRSDELREAMLEQIKKAKSDYEKTRREWSRLTKAWVFDLQLNENSLLPSQ